MAFEAGATYAILGADLSQLLEGFATGERASERFAEGVEQRVEKTERSFTHLGSAVAGIFTGIGFKVAEVGFDLVGRGAETAFNLISDGMGDAREAGLLLAQTENVIRSTGAAAGVTAEHVTDLASSLSDAAGTSLFGDDQVQESANLLLTFTNLKGEVLDAATAMSVDLAQALGGAPRDSAIQLGKALNDPIKGVSALTRVGVTFTDEQKAQIKAMQDAGNMAGAQGVILAELQKEFGGSAAAAAAAAGPMARIRGVLGEAAETVGGALLPALDSVTAWLGSPAVIEGINTFATNLAGGISSAAGTIGLVATSIVGIAGHVKNAFADGGITAAIDTFLFDVGKVVPILEPVTSFLRDILPQAVSLATTTFNLARDAVLTFIQAYNGDWQNSDRVLLIHQAFGILGQIIGGTVVPAIQSMVGWFQQNWDLVTKIGVAVGVAVAVFQTLSTVVTIVGSVSAAIGGMGAAITAAGGVVGTIVAILGGPLTIAIGAVALAAGALALAWQTNFGGIQEKTQAVVNWWTDTAMPAIRSTFDRVVEQVGIMRDAWNRDFETVRGFINTLKETWDTTTAAIGVAIDLVKGYLSSFRDTVQTKINEAVTFFTELPGRITSAVGSLPGLLVQAGKDLIQGLINGLKSIDVGSVLGGIIRSGIDAAKRMAGIHSPSTMTRDEIGKPMGEGIVVGLEGTAGTLKAALGKTILGAVQVGTMGAEGYHKVGKTITSAIAAGIDEGAPEVVRKLKTMLGLVIPDGAVPFAGEMGGNLGMPGKGQRSVLGQTIPAGAREFAGEAGGNLGAAFSKGFKDQINQGIPGAVQDALSKAARSDKGKDTGGDAGDLGKLITQGSGWLGAVVENTGDLGKGASDAFVGSFGESLELTRPVMIEKMSTTLNALDRESIQPWDDLMNERFVARAGWWMISIAEGMSGNRSAVDAANGMGNDIAGGIAAGVSAGVPAIQQAARDAATAALATAKAELGIASPSRVFADEVGLNITRGIAAGITSGWSDVDHVLGQLMTPVMPAMPAMPDIGRLMAPSFDLGSARGSGDPHISIGPIDLRGSDLRLQDVEDRIQAVMRVVMDEVRRSDFGGEFMDVLRARGA